MTTVVDGDGCDAHFVFFRVQLDGDRGSYFKEHVMAFL